MKQLIGYKAEIIFPLSFCTNNLRPYPGTGDLIVITGQTHDIIMKVRNVGSCVIIPRFLDKWLIFVLSPRWLPAFRRNLSPSSFTLKIQATCFSDPQKTIQILASIKSPNLVIYAGYLPIWRTSEVAVTLVKFRMGEGSI